MLRRSAVTLAVATVATATLVGSAHAQLTFAKRAQTIRAGVVLLERDRSSTTQVPMSAGPHLWFNLDSNRSVKPAGWTFVNPHANTTLGADTRVRWETINQSLGFPVNSVPAVGSRLTKRTAPYWEVRLSQINDAQINDYDVLVVNPIGSSSRPYQFTPAERERLRRFVDQGGVLWIDPGAVPIGGLDTANSVPVPFDIVRATNALEYKEYSHPLLSGLQPLSPRDIALLSVTPTGNVSGYDKDLVPPVAPAGLGGIFAESYVGFARYTPIVGVGPNQFSIGVARIGEGFVVATGRAISLKLNRVRTLLPGTPPTPNYAYDTNLAYAARDAVLDVDGVAAAKFAVNMIGLLREYSQSQGGSRKAGSSAIDVGAPLLRRAADTTFTGGVTAPVLYKGLLITTTGPLIRVYDADPARDIDGDGDPDDGLRDANVEGRDLVWQVQGTSGFSTPVCTEVPNTLVKRADGSLVTDQLLATDEQGNLHAFDLIRYNANGTLDHRPDTATNIAERELPGYPIQPPGGLSTATVPATGPNSPTVHENMAYMVHEINGNQGQLWMVDLVSGVRPRPGSRDWSMGGGGTLGTLPPFSAGATVGYIPILDNSGGADRVLYAPYRPVNAVGNSTPAGFVSLWLGAKGEKPLDYEPKDGNTATALTVTTRASRPDGLPIFTPGGAHPYGVRLTLLRADGTPYNAAEMTALFGNSAPSSSGGIITFPFANGNTQLPADVAGIRVDYSIDYGGSGPEIAAAIRGNVGLPDAQDALRKVIGPVALSSKGAVYVTASRDGGRGALFGFREEGRGSFRTILRYELYGQHSMSGQGVPDQTVPPAFVDGDPTQDFAPGFLRQPFTSFAFVGPPAVRGDVVYAAAAAQKGFVPTTVLMAFRAEPETPTIYVGDFPTGSSIVQQDLGRSTSTTRPEVVSVFPAANNGGITYDPETKLLRVENLSTLPKGQMQAILNLSQPVLIRRAGGTDELVYPNRVAGNRWDPLLWFTVLNGFKPGSAGVVVTGDTLYTGGASPLLNILTKGTPASVMENQAMLYAMDANISPNNDFLFPSPGREWQRQLWQVKAQGGGIVGNPSQRWPQISGVQNMQDFIVRLSQTLLPESENVIAIAAGEGVLAATGNDGMYTYSRSDFLVADEGRVAAFDPAGNSTFELTASGSPGEDDLGSAGNARPLVRPTRAYPLANGEFLVVDQGANRVFRVNRAGTESRSIANLRLDPRKTPANYPANGPLALNGPRDALTYTTIETAATAQGFFSPSDSGSPYEQWTHYLIADSGNHRLVEVVDRYAYDPSTRRIGNAITVDGKPQLSVLLWHSPSAVATKGYDYNSLSRVYVNGRFVYFAGIGGALPTTTDTGSRAPAANSPRETAGFGGVAVFDPLLPNGVAVFNTVKVPGFGANVFWNETTGSFNSAARPAKNQHLVNVTSVTARTIQVGANAEIVVMIADANGVYEVTYGTPPTNSEYVPDVVWMLPNEVYRVIRRNGTDQPLATNPRDLRATYARRLESGEVLIVNGYFGQTRGVRNPDGTFSGRDPFRGEVVQISGTRGAARFTDLNMGFGIRSITFNLELSKDTRGLVLPVFADRR